MTDILIYAGARTPFATWGPGLRGDGQPGGQLKPLDAFDLGAAAAKGALEKAGLGPTDVDRVVFGNCYHVGPHACYGARYVAHRAGLSVESTGITVNLACGAGLQAVATAAEEVARGKRLILAAGADSASNVPRNVFVPSFKDVMAGEQIASCAQILAEDRGVTRLDQDDWAIRSHALAGKARAAGWFAEEIIPVGEVEEDDAVLDDPKPELFAASKLLFETGQATKHNTHAVVDGGSALVMGAPGAAPKPPLGKFAGWAVAGVKPQDMALGSVAAIRKLLPSVGWTLDSVDLFEINETFASQSVIGLRELALPPEKVNVNGGALALGHPFGGTGGRLVLTLLRELRRRGKKRGVAAICVGGGQGIAVAVESAD